METMKEKLTMKIKIRLFSVFQVPHIYDISKGFTLNGMKESFYIA